MLAPFKKIPPPLIEKGRYPKCKLHMLHFQTVFLNWDLEHVSLHVEGIENSPHRNETTAYILAWSLRNPKDYV